MLRKIALALTLSVAGLSAAVLSSGLAQANDAYTLTQNQMVDAAELILRGTVSEVWAERDSYGEIWTLTAIEITHVYKGAQSTHSVVVYQKGGTIGSETLRVSGSARFSPGEDLLIYLESFQGDKLTVVGAFQGKFTVRIDPDSGEPMLVRSQLSHERYYDHRFLPHPSPENRLMLSDVELEIEQRLVQGWDGQPIPGASTERLQQVNSQPKVQQ